MEIAVDDAGNTRRFLFATSKVPRFIGDMLHPHCGIESVEESPYYWWYAYIKLAGRAAAGLHGLATQPPDEPGVANRLCYPAGMSFSEWWHLHVHLFAEPLSTATVRIARAEDELAEMKDPNQVNLVVPLDWPVSAILALTKSVIKQEQVERNIESEAEFKAPARSQAVYRLSEKWNVNGLENSYRVCRAKAEFEDEMTDQPLSWLEIGLRSGIAAAKHMGPGERAEHDFDRRKTLADLARRHHVKGKTYLQNSLTNQFP
jgi:hypothetical protein